MSSGWLFLGLLAIFVVAVLLEGRRQRRRYGRSRGGAALLRAGMLELQQHLQPERHVEVLLEEPKREDASQPGDPPKPGASTP